MLQVVLGRVSLSSPAQCISSCSDYSGLWGCNSSLVVVLRSDGGHGGGLEYGRGNKCRGEEGRGTLLFVPCEAAPGARDEPEEFGTLGEILT